MVMYDIEFETKENKIQTKDKIKPQHSRLFTLPAARDITQERHNT